MARRAPAAERRRLAVRGTVQGVGFRPFVTRHARALGLAGWVRNTGDGVEIEVEGEPAALDTFVTGLTLAPPPLARIEALESVAARPAGDHGFRILGSDDDGDATQPLPVGPDAATCAACLRELHDPSDRRHRYPFLNCTDCGPRFTILRALPYDRARTTMAAFVMCDACRREYEDVGDRRFHAEPVACPTCGPRVVYREMSEDGAAAASDDASEAAARALLDGRIVALKGLGGYQLACDAADGAAVARLRSRKAREAKPFGVMVPDLAAARRLCNVSPAEAAELLGPRAPIVLLRRRSLAEAEVAAEVAPGLDTLGVMVPYTPLHHLLMERVGRPLVMTSGNRSGEPIAAAEEEVRQRLGDIADAVLAHDRPIASRYDDSVVRVDGDGPVVLRRARGYAPEPIRLPRPASRPGLAVGAQMKGAFCVVRGSHAFPSQHLGDLDDALTAAHLAETVDLYRRLFRLEPEWLAHDLHPDYASTRFAEDWPAALPRVAVQHHHAHIASCLAEHGRTGPALGVCFDGTGYGPDGTVWGGELLVADPVGYRRLARLRHLPMAGGDAAAREPWRMAAAALVETFGDDADAEAARLLAEVPVSLRTPLLHMARRRLNAPLTSSAGRLFDAVAALAGVRRINAYEGQAAMELEARVDPAETGAYPLPLGDDGVWDTTPLIAAVVDDVRSGAGAHRVAARFHNGLASAVAEACARARGETGLDVVVLTGGCFQNARLVERVRAQLEARGLEVLTHRRVPPNDGGIALGQAVVAVARMTEHTEEG